MTLRKLAAALDVSIASLLEGEAAPKARRSSLGPSPSIEDLLEQAGVPTRWAAMSDDEWAKLLDDADAEDALMLCHSVGAERLATQAIRWALGEQERPLEERSVVARMLSRYMTREFQAGIKSQNKEAVRDSATAMERELVGAGR